MGALDECEGMEGAMRAVLTMTVTFLATMNSLFQSTTHAQPTENATGYDYYDYYDYIEDGDSVVIATLNKKNFQFVQQLIDQKDHIKETRPPNNGHVVNVNISIFISSIGPIDETNMDFRVDLILWQHWNDNRLEFKPKQNFTTIDLDKSISKFIWIPDLNFVNEKKALVHDTVSPNSMLRIWENGNVLYSIRISLTLSCPMNLHDFPMDTQVCPLYISSGAYTQKDLVFMWDKDRPMVHDPSISLPQYSFTNVTLSHSERHLRTGNFSMLMANFTLRRLMGFYLTQTYIPSTLLVLLSWISFWINPDAAPARVALGITTVLTLTTQSSGARSSLPKLSYVNAMDIWMATCLIFVFSSLLEFAAVNVMSRQARSLSSANPSSDKVEAATGVLSALHPWSAERIDRTARVLFPTLFLLFNVFYWLTFCVFK
ncbi:glycine receptor subunit alphaZ1-like [Lampetra fluviatilis]